MEEDYLIYLFELEKEHIWYPGISTIIPDCSVLVFENNEELKSYIKGLQKQVENGDILKYRIEKLDIHKEMTSMLPIDQLIKLFKIVAKGGESKWVDNNLRQKRKESSLKHKARAHQKAAQTNNKV